jgi:biopolymer transport protein ExbD
MNILKLLGRDSEIFERDIQKYDKQKKTIVIKADGQYDYVLNFSALNHVRSEKRPFLLGSIR